jgi:glycosyltransferase involved in cell wall biosynthesis
MNVAYDLRYAADHFTGIGTHAHALLQAMLDRPGDEHYTVLWNPALPAKRFDVSDIAHHPRVTWIERPWHPLHPADTLRLSAWLRRLGPDVFLSPFYLHPVSAGCPVALTLHDIFPLAIPDALSRTGRLLFNIALRGARRAPLVLTGSDFSRGELVRHGGFSATRVQAVALGVPRRAAVDPVRPDGVPDEPFALVVGQNRPRKNLRLLADAWDLLDPAETLALVHAGPHDARYASLEQMAARRTTGRVVRSLGWTTEAELAWLYAHARVVLFPSCYEGFGFPLVEAFAADVPVIAADIPVFREVGAAAAAYAAPDDPRAWASAIVRVSRDNAMQSALVEAGRLRAAELTYDRTAAGTSAALRELADAHRTLSPRTVSRQRTTPPTAASLKAPASVDSNV